MRSNVVAGFAFQRTAVPRFSNVFHGGITTALKAILRCRLRMTNQIASPIRFDWVAVPVLEGRMNMNERVALCGTGSRQIASPKESMRT